MPSTGQERRTRAHGSNTLQGWSTAHCSPSTIKGCSLEQCAWKSFCSSTLGEHKQNSKIPSFPLWAARLDKSRRV